MVHCRREIAGMRLNWFSPLPPSKSGISVYTASVLPALAKRGEVVLWTDQEEWDSSLERYAEVRRFQPERIIWAEVNRADVSFLNIGNNALFHEWIWQASQKHPGVLVLHDVRLHDFFAGVYLYFRRDAEGYCRLMRRYYGDEGALDAELFIHQQREPAYMAEHYPLTAPALENAIGAVVHTKYAFELARRHTKAPVARFELPYQSREASADEATGPKPGPPYRLIIFGHLGANRRIDSILRSLAELPEKPQFHLDIYGRIWNEGAVRSEIAELGIGDVVSLHGFVEDSELEAALDAAHLAINLRYPTVGEASLSQLLIWEHALPTLVTNVGWYADLPLEAVAFVRPEHEIADLRVCLRNFLANPEWFARMGEYGRCLLEERHAPDVYADALLRFGATAQRASLSQVGRRLAARVGSELSRWMPPGTMDPLVNRAAREIHALTSGAESMEGVAEDQRPHSDARMEKPL